MAETLKIVQYGLDPLGTEILRNLAGRSDFEVAAAIDSDATETDLSISEATQIPGFEEAPVLCSFEDLPQSARPDAVFHTAGTGIKDTLEQLKPICESGASVVTSCDEMLFPWHREPELASEIDAICQREKVKVAGAGTDPGAAFNHLPISLAHLTGNIRSVSVESVSNAADRRSAVQDRIGYGLDPETFHEGWANGELGITGFHESLLIVAHSIGWHIPALDQWCEPILAEREFKLPQITVKSGQVCGLYQMIRATIPTGESIQYELRLMLEAEEPNDQIHIVGEPPVEVSVPGTIQGEAANAWALIKTLPRLQQLTPGVKLITDLPSAPVFSPDV
jgi:4-hydroxy-tetrahydrodipicolinate reductase